ncbi:unnamed protein product [Lymnaea stagnalis]|uniref:WD repeat-containing protein 79 n=1 Tax=Lymnaea stagnalis TaxID=6523 RepID=A0AAV2H902_LYMST
MIPRQVIRQQQNTPPPKNHTAQTTGPQQSSIILDSGSKTAVDTTHDLRFRCNVTQIALGEKYFNHDTTDDLILKASMSSKEKVIDGDLSLSGKSNGNEAEGDKNEGFTIPEIPDDNSGRNLSLISNKLTQQIYPAETSIVAINNDSQNLIMDSRAVDNLNTSNNSSVTDNIKITGHEQFSNYLNSSNSFEKDLSVDDSLRLDTLNTAVLSHENALVKECLRPSVEEVPHIDDDHGNTTQDVNNKVDSSNRQVLKSVGIEEVMDYNDIPKAVLSSNSSNKHEEVFISSIDTLNDITKQHITENKISDVSTKTDSHLSISMLNTLSGNLDKNESFLSKDSGFSRQLYQEQREINSSYAAILQTERQEILTSELTTSQNFTEEMNMLNTENDVTVAGDLRYNLTTKSVPSFFASACREFQENYVDNFLRGCKWSPDGNCVLTNSNDNCLRVFQPFETFDQDQRDNLQMVSKVNMKESGQIYDFVWHPRMSLWQPEFCRVASTCTGIPIHMWDTTTGSIVANYRAYDQYDEVTAAYSVSFSLDGSKLYAGYNKAIRIFDTEYPVRSCKLVKTFNTQKKDGQTGIISCFTHSPNRDGLYVAGSYSRHIGIYDSACDRLVCLIQGQHGGITHVKFSPDGSKIYSGGRKDAEILCWDVRNMGKILFSALRDVKTNQRIYFDLSQSGRYLVSGNNDGTVAFWDTLSSFEEINGDVFLKPCSQFVAHDDCVNGVSFNCHYDMIATASGQRHFRNFDESDSDNSDEDSNMKEAKPWDFSLKLWKMPMVLEEMAVS